MAYNPLLVTNIQFPSRRVDTHIPTSVMVELMEELTPAEFRLYMVLFNAKLEKPMPEFYADENLARISRLSEKTVRNCKVGLKAKKLLKILKRKTSNGESALDVVLGREQVQLYESGMTGVVAVPVSVYKKAIELFPINNAEIPLEKRRELLGAFNAFCKTNKGKY